MYWITLLLMACGSAPDGGGKGGDPFTDEVCNDLQDNDGDGLADCMDPDCAGDASDRNGDGEPDPCPEICGDGVDNDVNGATDCEDTACDGGCPEVCTDQRDNDGDGRFDCDDNDCLAVCDVDRDGHLGSNGEVDDCDDTDPAINPGVLEVCDGIDNDCNGLVDLDDPLLDHSSLTAWFLDDDGDGFGDSLDFVEDCDPVPDRVDQGGDCAVADPDIHPGADEVCDALDNNCDGLVDDEDPTVDPSTMSSWHLDADGDGFGDPASLPVASCAPQPSMVANADDCDDSNPRVGASGDWLVDLDGDGFGSGTPAGPSGCVPPAPDVVSESLGVDCDDADPTINPGAPDPCGDAFDANCDTLDCVEWFDGFEYGLTNLWTTGGDAPWAARTGTVYAGWQAAASGDLVDNQVSRLQTTADFPAGGEVEFWSAGDTERNWDFLRLFIDGVMVYSESGTWSWTRQTFVVSPGSHVFEWVYQKDASVSVGDDTVWIDEVTLRGATQ